MLILDYFNIIDDRGKSKYTYSDILIKNHDSIFISF